MEEVLLFWIPLRMLWIFVLPVRIHFYYFSFVLQENPCSKGSLERHPIGVQGVFASDPTGCLGLTFPSLPSSQLTKSSCKAIFHNYIVDWNPFALQNLKKISEIKHIGKVHFWIEESSHSLDWFYPPQIDTFWLTQLYLPIKTLSFYFNPPAYPTKNKFTY